MKLSRLYFFVAALVFVLTFEVTAQKAKTQKPLKPVKKAESTRPKENSDVIPDEKKVKDIITFLGFVLNTLGSSSTSSSGYMTLPCRRWFGCRALPLPQASGRESRLASVRLIFP